jgi:pimeloyl-ACP methyl ester carboxylesterase
MAALTPVTASLPRLDIPALVRCGAEDAAVPVAMSHLLADHLPQGELQVVAGCGHALPIEDEAATREALATTLRRASGVNPARERP